MFKTLPARLFTLTIILSFCTFLLSAQTLFTKPLVGGVTENSARMFIRTTEPTNITVEYTENESFSISTSKTDVTQSNNSNVRIMELTGLKPLTRYYYRIFVNGETNGEIYRFKTFPKEGEVGNYRIVVGSCNYSNEPGGGHGNPFWKNDLMFQNIVDFDPNIVIHLGDWNYPPSRFGANHMLNKNLAAESFSLRYNDYNFAEYIIPNLPIDYIYDDDFSQNGTAGWTYPTTSSKTLPNGDTKIILEDAPLPVGLRDSAVANYFRFFPGYPQIDNTGIHHQFKLGHVEFFITDTRNSKDPVHLPFKYNKTLNAYDFKPPANHSTLGETQKQWLLNALKSSTSPWKIIGSSVVFNKRMGELMPIVLAGQLISKDIVGYATSIAYMWPGYPKDQRDVLQTIRENDIKNVVVISGDTHSSMVDDGKNAGLSELSASGWSAGNEGYLNGTIDSLLGLLGLPVTTKDFLWNGGGTGVANKNYSDSYGTVEVFKKDSMRMCVIDEFLQTLGCVNIKYRRAAGEEDDDDDDTTVTNIYDFQKEKLTLIYPNPSKDRIGVVLNIPQQVKEAYYQITDIQGKVIKPKVQILQDDKFLEILLSNYASGMYLFNLDLDGNLFSKKFVVHSR